MSTGPHALPNAECFLFDATPSLSRRSRGLQYLTPRGQPRREELLRSWRDGRVKQHLIVRLLELNFELEGHEVLTASDGRAALDRLDAELAADRHVRFI
jgi:hypothetical protein